jgi:hypothetical protein
MKAVRWPWSSSSISFVKLNNPVGFKRPRTEPNHDLVRLAYLRIRALGTSKSMAMNKAVNHGKD